jgi:transposase InsO family protein
MGHNLLQITNATTSSEAEAHNLIQSGYLSDLGDQHFERIHSDLHEVLCLTSSGYRYWLMFIDDCSRYAWIYLLKRKSEAFDAFKLFKVMVKKQYDAVICFFHEDKGGEYIGHKWDAFCGEHGIWRKHTTRATPQQNGVAERKNRTLAEIVTAMLNEAKLPKSFWGEALAIANKVLNMSTVGTLEVVVRDKRRCIA